MRHSYFIAVSSLLFLVLASGTDALSAAELQAGAARRSIVPPTPTPMGGFNDRTSTFEGVHDDIFARALVLDNVEVQLVIIGSDLMAIEPGLTGKIRKRVQEETGIPEAHVMVSCAHNHSAPSLYQLNEQERSESKVEQYFVDQFAGAAIDAWKERQPARLGFHAGELLGMTRNRQQDNGMIDPQVGVVLVQKRDSRDVIATLFNFTGHPVIVGSKNMLLTGEYPGAACRAVENVLGGVGLFTQGAAGDVTVHRSGDPFEEIERVGRTLAAEVIKSAGFISGEITVPLSAAHTTIELPARTIPTVQEAQKQVDRLNAQIADAEARQLSTTAIKRLKKLLPIHSINLKLARERDSNPAEKPLAVQADVQVMRIGDVVLGSMPGEIFVEYALELRSRIAQDIGKSFCLVGYANGYVGYIVTPRAQRTGGYEASIARVAPDAGRVMVEATVELVHSLPQ